MGASFVLLIKSRTLYWFLLFILQVVSCKEQDQKYKSRISTKRLIPTAEEYQAVKSFCDSAKDVVQIGDIVVRQGNDFTSRSLRMLNQRDKTFSHIGIISQTKKEIKVLHILGGEWNPDAKVIFQSLVAFVNPEDNNAIALYRLPLNRKEKIKFVLAADSIKNAGISFDMDFNLETDNKMYCAEYIYKSLNAATMKRLKIPLSHINNFAFVGIDDILLLPGTQQIMHLFIKRAIIKK